MKLLALLVASALSTTCLADETIIELRPGFAKIVETPAIANTIVVGNPNVADVTVSETNGQFIHVVGKIQGVTNILLLDAKGAAFYEAEIRVMAGNDDVGRVTMINRRQVGSSEIFSCSAYYCDLVQGSALRTRRAAPWPPYGEPPVSR